MTAQAQGGKHPENQNPSRKRDVQPGTHKRGTSWQSHDPDPDDEDDKLESALEDSFPASDPPSPAAPTATGWEAVDKEKKSDSRK
jgi:hypothetical protein